VFEDGDVVKLWISRTVENVKTGESYIFQQVSTFLKNSIAMVVC